jgi:hypothetical protein
MLRYMRTFCLTLFCFVAGNFSDILLNSGSRIFPFYRQISAFVFQTPPTVRENILLFIFRIAESSMYGKNAEF